MTPTEQLNRASETLRRLAEEATPGPWEHGDRWHVAGVNGRFGKDRCVYCDRGEPSWIGERDINGERMMAHVHTDSDPWYKHGILAARDDGPVSVVWDTDEYGYMRDADAAFIALMDPTLALLLADWLDNVATNWAGTVCEDQLPPHALALAEHINERTSR